MYIFLYLYINLKVHYPECSHSKNTLVQRKRKALDYIKVYVSLSSPIDLELSDENLS